MFYCVYMRAEERQRVNQHIPKRSLVWTSRTTAHRRPDYRVFPTPATTSPSLLMFRVFVTNILCHALVENTVS